MAPIMKFGLATNSIGYLVTDDNAMVWRGPMASKALLQMLQETLWPDLDYWCWICRRALATFS
jgi:ATP-binding protein involved in chromosome partitioning